MDSRKCQTAAVSPAEPGVYLLLIKAAIEQKLKIIFANISVTSNVRQRL